MTDGGAKLIKDGAYDFKVKLLKMRSDKRILFYSSITEREGSWQKSDGYLLSDSKERLETKIASMPKHSEDLSWEYSEIKSFEVSDEGHTRFSTYSSDGILAIDGFDLNKFKMT